MRKVNISRSKHTDKTVLVPQVRREGFPAGEVYDYFAIQSPLFPGTIRRSRRDLSLLVISLQLPIILNARLAYSGGAPSVTIQRKDSQRTRPTAVNRPRELHFMGSKEFYGYTRPRAPRGAITAGTWRGILKHSAASYIPHTRR